MFFKRPSSRYGRTPEPETPYQRAAQAWDDRIGSARIQARNWRLMAFGSLYQVYTAPGQVTDIALEAGEQLVGTGPVAAGDTVRWIIGDTESGSGPTRRIHILVKPTRADLQTNLVINTDRRTYHLELRAAGSSPINRTASWRFWREAGPAKLNATTSGSTPILPISLTTPVHWSAMARYSPA